MSSAGMFSADMSAVDTSSDDIADGIDQPAEKSAVAPMAPGEWAETALTVMFTAVAVLFASFLAVVTGLV
jgi:hypothetical protein